MPILTLLNRVKERLDEAPHPLTRESVSMCGCYLMGLAMQAISDGQLVEEERRHFMEMADLFEVSPSEATRILEQAGRADEATVNQIRQCLMDSKYKYYFILDLQIMAHQDQVVHPVETEVVARFGEILGVDALDRQFLVQLADAVVEEDPDAKLAWQQRFLQEGGLQDEAAPRDFRFYTCD